MPFNESILREFENRHSGEIAVIVGRGPTTFDYTKLNEFDGPFAFLNDAVQLERHVSRPAYFFAIDEPILEWFGREIRSIAILPSSIRVATVSLLESCPNQPAITFYECDRTPRERLLRFTRQELSASAEIYNGSATILTALHFMWFCGCSGVVFIGCDGINDPRAARRIGDADHGYDKRLENVSKTTPGWQYDRIRAEQERVCRLLGLEFRYEGTPPIPHPNRFHRRKPAIPKVAHYVWLGGAIPAFFRSNMERFRELHPTWEVHLWHGLPNELPAELRRACLRQHQICMRSDIIRVWLLHRFGGIYLDGDVFPVRPFDDLLHYDHFFGTEKEGHSATNCVVGAAKDSDFINNLFDRVCSLCSRKETSFKRTAFGPLLYTSFIHAYTGLVNALPEHYFCLFQDHEFAYPLTQRPFPEIHRALVEHESRMTDGVWPYAIHTYGIPADQLPLQSGQSSEIPAIGRADALLTRLAHCEVVGAEIGVADGRMSGYLLGHHPQLILHMVDRWSPPPTGSGYARSIDIKAGWSLERHERAMANAQDATAFAGQRRSLIQAESFAAATGFADKSLDFVFIDADHSLDAVKMDIAAWGSKVRSGGWLCGHDYQGLPNVNWGVRQAVDDFTQSSSLALELDVDDTWFIRIP